MGKKQSNPPPSDIKFKPPPPPPPPRPRAPLRGLKPINMEFIVTDKDMIKRITSRGTKVLSCGYSCDVFDGEIKNIKYEGTEYIMNYKVEIPEIYLIQIAICGKMGSGELLDIMRRWAYNECVKRGLEGKVIAAQEDNLNKIKQGIINTMGKEKFAKYEKTITEMLKGLKKNG